MKFCQSCGMPLTHEILGTATDGRFYSDFYPRSFMIE